MATKKTPKKPAHKPAPAKKAEPKAAPKATPPVKKDFEKLPAPEEAVFEDSAEIDTSLTVDLEGAPAEKPEESVSSVDSSGIITASTSAIAAIADAGLSKHDVVAAHLSDDPQDLSPAGKRLSIVHREKDGGTRRSRIGIMVTDGPVMLQVSTVKNSTGQKVTTIVEESPEEQKFHEDEESTEP